MHRRRGAGANLTWSVSPFAASLRRRRATLNHGAFTPRTGFLYRMGATMEDDMVVDAALWVILAGIIALIAYGCRMTRSAPKLVEEPFGADIDRAA
jgi:hypothetical protein